VKKTQKYFKKLLKDPKNEEYKDKIYYEMARFEYKRNLQNEAIVYYNKSLRAETKNPAQKGYSYWRLAEIYYDKQKDFVKAKAYYDSTVTSLDTAEEAYKSILKRQKVLADFLREYIIVEREDSLQRYARMDTAERNKRIAILVARDALLAQKQAKANKAAEKEAARQKRVQEALEGTGNTAFDQNKTGISGASPTGGPSDGKWYFSSPALMATGRQEFVKKWGNRPLADDWRRSSREASITTIPDGKDSSKTDPSAAKEKTKDDKSASSKKDNKGKEEDDKKENTSGIESPEERKAYYLRDIPDSPEKMTISNDALKVALHNLGKIYEQKLDELFAKNKEKHK
jgi:hypothetical protein